MYERVIRLMREQIEDNYEITYQLSFLLDDFHDVAFLCAGNNASSQLLAQNLYLLPTSTRRVKFAAVAAIRVRSGVLKKLLVRTK